ncbi:hypothetical protein VKT23_010915 [Stygiomarasmius scandens]|uniref:Heterokaryon incompatibility domain-containing protein n=1 Tax=Marasmiellus scandens TaxID=2682957 RepID=A0ABR1JG78_9AGAR
MMDETEYRSLSSRSVLQLPSSRDTTLLKRSFISRLFVEYPGVRGCGWFARHTEQRFHVFGNTIRVLSYIILAPFILAFPILFAVAMVYFGLSGDDDDDDDDDDDSDDDDDDGDDSEEESYDIPLAVLRHPQGSRNSAALVPLATYGTGLDAFKIYPPSYEVYETTSFEPQWMLEVKIVDGKYLDSKQVAWEGRMGGYSAISYDVKSAHVLLEKAGGALTRRDKEAKDYSPPDRRCIAEQLLKEYCSAAREKSPNRTEYIWLDEFCISEGKDGDYGDYKGSEVSGQRKVELGRIPDIFRAAKTIVVFCSKPQCQHVTLDCAWSKRLFTLGEILHAQSIELMTRVEDEKPDCSLFPESAQEFRGRMLHQAALARKWHLHSLLWNSINSGGETWQMAIHSLMVEAIRRDIETGYTHHNLLGQGLNGLLPRRACLHHLKGEDGWADLAWLLELNQGFYNAAALAAVCGLNDSPYSGNGWLGPPIQPSAGSERLEPLVHAFPVELKNKNGEYTAHLNIIGAETIELESYVKRDSKALYRIPAFKWKKIFSMALLAVCWITGIILIVVGFPESPSDSSDPNSPDNTSTSVDTETSFESSTSTSSSPSDSSPDPSVTKILIGILLIYLSSIAFNIFHMTVSSWYVSRGGWVFLSDDKMMDGSEGDSAWGSKPETILGQLDPSLKKLDEWGDRQMIPKWDATGSQFKVGHIVDLRLGIRTRVVVTKKPNSMVILAIHGTGVTCMLLNRPDGGDKVAEKVGMVNLPPYILAQTEKCGSLRIGVLENEKEKNGKSRTRQFFSWMGRMKKKFFRLKKFSS